MDSQKIKKLEREIKLLRELLGRDELTGLYNRRGFRDEAEKFIKEIIISNKIEKRKKFLVKNLAIIIFDIDYFKKLNDTYGHTAGDSGIKFLSKLIKERIRTIDFAMRWGGEEFVVGLVGADEKDAFNIAEDIRKRLEYSKMKLPHRKGYVKFTVSAGVASFDKAKDFDKVFNSADKALYKAKNSGRNRTVRFSQL